ncbi:MAG: hypothetical protein H5U40_08655, partial [Polyangiaceae bacterium]|nr:hypothetical protein [Polyangiaceae bacterium]
MLRALGIASCLCVFVACAPPEPERRAPPEPSAERPRRSTPEEVWLPVDDEAGREYAIRGDFTPDTDFIDDRPVEARQVIYRFQTRVPAIFGPGIGTVPRAATELLLLVTPDRLRARFSGPGWPVHPEAEVRVRGDRPGTYVFDGAGGRPLGPGQMTHWFEGGPPRRRVRVWTRTDPPPPGDDDYGSMVCRFLAEWASSSVDALLAQCDGSIPRWIRIGPYTGDRTADVPVVVPRRKLRADEAEAPPRIAAPSSWLYHPASTYRRMLPRPRPATSAEPAEAPEGARGLRVRNLGRIRMVVTLDGTPLGWVEPDEEVDFPDVPEGLFMVGGMRPLGGLAA